MISDLASLSPDLFRHLSILVSQAQRSSSFRRIPGGNTGETAVHCRVLDSPVETMLHRVWTRSLYRAVCVQESTAYLVLYAIRPITLQGQVPFWICTWRGCVDFLDVKVEKAKVELVWNWLGFGSKQCLIKASTRR